MDENFLITHQYEYKSVEELEELAQKMNRIRKRMQNSSSKIDIVREIVKRVYDIGYRDACIF